jgi:2-methylcitrate dehydratase PrpD
MLSSIALRRKAGIHEFTDEFVRSAPVQALMQRVETVLDPEIEAKGYHVMRSMVEVDLEDGRHLVQPSDDRYRGGPDLPFTRQELVDKFMECGELVLPAERLRAVLAKLEAFDSLADIRELADTLAVGETSPVGPAPEYSGRSVV